jgi:hypothetical protein
LDLAGAAASPLERNGELVSLQISPREPLAVLVAVLHLRVLVSNIHHRGTMLTMMRWTLGGEDINSAPCPSWRRRECSIHSFTFTKTGALSPPELQQP